MSLKSSYRIVFTTSVTCVVRSTCGDARCTRSPMPVRDGVKTSCPAARSGPRTYLNPYDPPHAPCTRTNVVMAGTLDPGCGGRQWARCQSSAGQVGLDHGEHRGVIGDGP